MLRSDCLGPARGLMNIERSRNRRGNNLRRKTGLRSDIDIWTSRLFGRCSVPNPEW